MPRFREKYPLPSPLPSSSSPLPPYTPILLFSYNLYPNYVSLFLPLLLFFYFSFIYYYIYRAEMDRASTPFPPILMLMYIVPGVSIIPRPLFRANVAFFDRKNGAYVKILAIFTGGAAHFSPPETHDREFSPIIGYNPFHIAADHPCAGIKRPRSAASRRGKKGGEPGKEHENPLLTMILPHPALV